MKSTAAILLVAALLVGTHAAQQAPACPFTEANYGPFADSDVKLIQDACDPYSIITMEQFCRACTCAINKGLVTSLERAGSNVGNMTARKAFTDLAGNDTAAAQAPGLANCGALESSIMLKNGAISNQTLAVASTCWNLGQAFLQYVYESCDYSTFPTSSAGLGSGTGRGWALFATVVTALLAALW